MKITIEDMKEKLSSFGKLRTKKDKLKTELKLIDEQIEQEEPGLVEIMEKLKIQNMTLPKIGTFYMEAKAFPQVKDNEKLIKWLNNNERGDLVKETVHYQTLVGICRELLEGNMEAPDGVEVYMKRQIRLRRNTNGRNGE